MKRSALGIVLLLAACAVACGDDEERTPSEQLGEGGQGGGNAGSGAGGAAGDGGSGAETAEGGEGGAGGAGGAEDPFVCPPPPVAEISGDPVCDPGASWGEDTPVPMTPGLQDQLVAITPDELTLVWYSVTGSAGSLRVADRASVEEEFGEGQVIERDVIAVSPDGLRLVALAEDSPGFVELTRTARGEAFSGESTDSFELLNAEASASGRRLISAAFSADDRTLYYSVLDESDEYPLRVSRRANGEPWPVGERVEVCQLRGFGVLARMPTGVSADGLTLFYYDPIYGTANAAWRASAEGDFVLFQSLGERAPAQPNTTCTRLYYTDAENTLFYAQSLE